MKRYGIFPVIGDGQSPETAYRTAAADVPGVNTTSLIPSNPDGSPKYLFSFDRIGAVTLASVGAVSNSYLFPDYPLDAQMSGMESATRTAMVQSVEAFNLDGNGLNLDASHQDSESYRDVVQRIAQQIEPVVNLNNFDVTEPQE